MKRRAAREAQESEARGYLPQGGLHPPAFRDLEQIKFLLGHSSIQTTEQYLGAEQEIVTAVNDNLGL